MPCSALGKSSIYINESANDLQFQKGLDPNAQHSKGYIAVNCGLLANAPEAAAILFEHGQN